MALLIGGAAAASPALSGLLYMRHPALPFAVAGVTAAVGALVLLLVRLVSRPIPSAGDHRT